MQIPEKKRKNKPNMCKLLKMTIMVVRGERDSGTDFEWQIQQNRSVHYKSVHYSVKPLEMFP